MYNFNRREEVDSFIVKIEEETSRRVTDAEGVKPEISAFKYQLERSRTEKDIITIANSVQKKESKITDKRI